MNRLLLIPLLAALLCPAARAAEGEISLSSAVALALGNNKYIQIAALEKSKADAETAALKTRRYPAFWVAGLAFKTFEPVNFNMPAKALGPLPLVDTPINVLGTDIHGAAMAMAYQPLSEQYRIALGIKAQQLGAGIANEDLRKSVLEITAKVKQVYYGLVQSEKALLASAGAEATYEEAVREGKEHLDSKTILPYEFFRIQAKLASQKYTTLKIENQIKSLTENLNRLMGRDVDSPLAIDGNVEPDLVLPDLAKSRKSALANNPEIRKAELKASQARFGVSIEKSKYIPDLGFGVQYTQLGKTNYIPDNYSGAGLFLTWDVFDWGRKQDNIRKSRSALAQANNLTEETRRQVIIEVSDKHRALAETLALINAAGLERDAAKDELRVLENKYAQDAAKKTDILAARAKYAEAEFQYRKAVLDFLSQKAALQSLISEEI
ncbi:MAG: TolC family protein [Elusimicrobiaceae bacterium]|jgi:outer membrane protein TolC